MGRSISTVIKAAFPSYPIWTASPCTHNNMATSYNNLTEKEVQKIMEDFKRFDTNGDMFIEKDELRHMLTVKLGEVLSVEEVGRLMSWADTNKDGKVSYGEYFDMIAYGEKNDFSKLKSIMKKKEQEKDSEKLIRATFDRFDPNMDGTITRAEFKQAMKEVDQDIADDVLDRMVSNADDDNDGNISYEEFKNMVVVVRGGTSSSFLCMAVPNE